MFTIQSLMTPVNLIGVISTISLVIGLASLFCIYVLPLAIFMPVVIAEMFGYGVCGFFVVAGQQLDLNPGVKLFLVFLGLLGLLPMFAISCQQHWPGAKVKGYVSDVLTVTFLCSVIWGYFAIRMSSELLGLITLAAFFCFTLLLSSHHPMTYVVGHSNSIIPKFMSVLLYLLVLYIYAGIHELDQLPTLYPFRRPVQLIGSFMYLLCCIIIGSKWYTWTKANYVWCNIFAFVSGYAIFLAGSTVPSLVYLKGMAGTFFVLMTVVKYAEMPWNRIGYSWGLVGFSGLSYGIVLWSNQHPDWLLTVFRAGIPITTIAV